MVPWILYFLVLCQTSVGQCRYNNTSRQTTVTRENPTGWLRLFVFINLRSKRLKKNKAHIYKWLQRFGHQINKTESDYSYHWLEIYPAGRVLLTATRGLNQRCSAVDRSGGWQGQTGSNHSSDAKQKKFLRICSVPLLKLFLFCVVIFCICNWYTSVLHKLYRICSIFGFAWYLLLQCLAVSQPRKAAAAAVPGGACIFPRRSAREATFRCVRAVENKSEERAPMRTEKTQTNRPALVL